MKWNKVLDKWKYGTPLLSKNINKPFIWRSSAINKDENTNYKDEFIINTYLTSNTQDYSPFTNQFNKYPHAKHTISFMNLSNDSLLIVPIPRKNKNYSNLYYFMINASNTQQKHLWNRVASEARKLLKKNKYIWIYTHGFGVNYLHVRISTKPIYYHNSKLAIIPK
jgi:hypothetical protein